MLQTGGSARACSGSGRSSGSTLHKLPLGIILHGRAWAAEQQPASGVMSSMEQRRESAEWLVLDGKRHLRVDPRAIGERGSVGSGPMSKAPDRSHLADAIHLMDLVHLVDGEL